MRAAPLAPPTRGRYTLPPLFTLTGAALVLPGTLLPQLEKLWNLQDGRSGILFFLFFTGTTLGAFCARGALGRLLLLAVCATAVPLPLLARLHGAAVAIAMLAFGFGLGLAMTSISLLRSRAESGRRFAELTRLNLLWAIGACLAPPLLLQTSAAFGLTRVLAFFAGVIVLCGAIATASEWNAGGPQRDSRQGLKEWRLAPLRFVVTLPLATGIEAGVGAWLTTYAVRRGAAPLGVLSAGSALWAGLLLSRLLFSSTRLRLREDGKARFALSLLLVGGLVVMVLSADPGPIAMGALCAGFAIGPVYPYLLARLLNHGEFGNAGFLLAGVGSAALPLLIGQVSQHSHSLRVGLAVPLAASLVLLASDWQRSKSGLVAWHG